MQDLVGPCVGVLAGLVLIRFREPISIFLEKFYRKFPKYEDGIKTLNVRFEVRPVFVTSLGIIIILFSAISFLTLL